MPGDLRCLALLALTRHGWREKMGRALGVVSVAPVPTMPRPASSTTWDCEYRRSSFRVVSARRPAGTEA